MQSIRTANQGEAERLMGTGIIICGLNGTGKSTLGKALAEKINFHFADIEDLYFPKTDSQYIYSSPRSHEEVKTILLSEIKAHPNFVLSSVKGDYGDTIHSFFQYAILITAPANSRIQRVKNRSFQTFGSRMLPGGDLYEQEATFFDFVKSRTENTVEDWVNSLSCPIVRIDGTKPVEENIEYIIEHILH